jgi:hypothetical protein
VVPLTHRQVSPNSRYALFPAPGNRSAVEKATAPGRKNIEVTRRECHAGRRADEIQISLIPVLFDSGGRLFECVDAKRLEMELTRVM